jgi:prevent-host-death family protein
MTTTIINTADAKEQFSELVNRVSHNNERIILTRRGKEIAAIIPLDDLLVLMESQHKDDLQQAIEALKQAREQGTISLEDFKEELG